MGRDHTLSDEYYTPEEISKMFKITPATVYKWIAKGQLLVIPMGPHTMRVPKQALEDLIKPVEPNKREEK